MNNLLIANYITSAWRNILRHKLFSIINIFGLAIGFATCLFITVYVQFELSYDKWLPNAKNIFRYETTYALRSIAPHHQLTAPGAPRDALLSYFSEIESAVNIIPKTGILKTDELISNEEIWWVHDDFFEVIDLPLIEGDKKSALEQNGNLLISETMAEKYFGDTSPINQLINLNPTSPESSDLRIVGIFKDIPDNSQFNFNFITSLDPLAKPGSSSPVLNDRWDATNGYLYLKLKSDSDYNILNSRMSEFIQDNAHSRMIPEGRTISDAIKPVLNPLLDVHLKGPGSTPIKTPGSIEIIYAMSATAMLVLFIACINFINLTTAKSVKRTKEISLRKVAGARRPQLILQFLGETVFISTIALVLAYSLVEVSLPLFAAFIDKTINDTYLYTIEIIVLMVCASILTGIISGIYPAVILSKIKPSEALNRTNSNNYSGSNFFKTSLVIFQFSIAIILGITTLVIFAQQSFIQNKDLGYTKENKIIINDINAPYIQPYVPSIMERIRSLPDVENVGGSSLIPTTETRNNWYFQTPDFPEKQGVTAKAIYVDFGYFETYNIKLAAGRFFSKEHSIDGANDPRDDTLPHYSIVTVIINEKLLKDIGYQNPQDAIGKSLISGTESPITMEIVGVVPDLYYRSLREEFQPHIYIILQDRINRATVLYREGATPETVISQINDIWQDYAPTYAMQYEYLDKKFDELYADINLQLRLLLTFTLLAIFVSTLGLYALSSFTAENRTKEIGIRKTLGARVYDIVKMLLLQFSRPVILANIIAWPVGYLIALNYLQGYANKTDISLTFFIFPSLITLLIAWGTMSFHAYRVARANPIDALRTD